MSEKDKKAKETYWDSAAKYGAIIGGIFSLIALLQMWATNREVEMYSYVMVVSLVFLVKAAVLFLCQIQVIRRRLPLYEKGMGLGDIFSYLLSVMFFAGIVYGSFCAVTESNLMIEQYEAGMTRLYDTLQSANEAFGDGGIEYPIEVTQAPSMISNLFNTVASMIVGGGILALFVGAIYRRSEPVKPKENL